MENEKYRKCIETYNSIGTLAALYVVVLAFIFIR